MVQIVEFLEAIKFSHSIFALPFALIATLLATNGTLPTLPQFVFVILAMVGARTWAMGINRIVDAHIDAKNPRTASRALPAGRLPAARMLVFSVLGALLFIGAAAALSKAALYCAVPVLLILASYSYTKRFTFLCHFWLGFCLGLAPLGAWVALRQSLEPALIVLTFGITFWVAGFDIIYALQDENFDKSQKLHSIPAHFGTERALLIARLSHVLAALSFVFFGVVFNLGIAYFVGLGLSVALMIYEHFIVRKGDLNRIDLAFFNLNGWISVILLLSTSASLYFNVH